MVTSYNALYCFTVMKVKLNRIIQTKLSVHLKIEITRTSAEVFDLWKQNCPNCICWSVPWYK